MVARSICFLKARCGIAGMKGIAFLVYAVMFFTMANAQAPTLDPEKTVNLSNGSMSFALPLGVVKGAGGRDFPINLYYRAGIRYNQDASPVGLGFSYDAGMITRKEVFVNDDLHGENWEKYEGEYHSNLPLYLCFYYSLCGLVVGMVPGVEGFIASFIFGQATNAIMSTSPLNYTAGGSHMLEYTGTDKNGNGFFNGGEDVDLPDIYFVNSPFVSGELIWVGSAANGHFVLRNTQGSPIENSETVQVLRTTDSDGHTTFKFILTDGTRVYFDKSDKMSSAQMFWCIAAGSLSDACQRTNIHCKESVPQSWRITKVLFSDYTGGENPLDLSSNAKGGWICFDYEEIVGNLCQPWMLQQTMPLVQTEGYNGGIYSQVGRWTPTKMQFLKSVITANERADYNYPKDENENYTRLDNLWYDRDNNCMPKLMPLLDNIEIKGKDGKIKSNIKFNTCYELRRSTFSASTWFYQGVNNFWHDKTDAIKSGLFSNNSIYQGAGGYGEGFDQNYEARTLTLKSIEISNSPKGKTYPIKFSYSSFWDQYLGFHLSNLKWAISSDDWSGCGDHWSGKDNPNTAAADRATGVHDRYYWVEQKDIWGYFRPNDYTQMENNFWNPKGYKDRACTGDVPYAAAWSLTEMILPSGLKVQWEYESNKYDRVNGESVQSTDAGDPRYGGGIRVKKVTATGNFLKPVSLSYFYTAVNGEFDESTGGSSGYASVEPNYYINSVDVRPPKTRGGLYTPAMVGYEKVQVVKNYNAGALPSAPYGYTIYEYTHAGDPAVPGYYPNSGYYGDIDCSWKRGLLRSVAVKAANNKTIDSTYNDYAFVVNGDFDSRYADIKMKNIMGFATYGWPKLTKTVQFHNGARHERSMVYGDANSNSKDYTSFSTDRLQLFYSETSPSFTGYPALVTASQCVVTKGLTGTDATKPAVFLGWYYNDVYNSDYVYIQSIYNIDNSFNAPNAKWTAVYKVPMDISDNLDLTGWTFTGMDFIDYDGNGTKNDLAIQLVYYSTIRFVILKDVSLSTGNPPTLNCTKIYKTITPNIAVGNNVMASAIGNINGTANGSRPDLFFYELKGQSAHVFTVMDIDFPNANGQNGYTSAIATDIQLFDPINKIPPAESHARFLDLDGDGKLDDLVTSDLYASSAISGFQIKTIIRKNITLANANTVKFIGGLSEAIDQRVNIGKPNDLLKPFCGLAQLDRNAERYYPFFINDVTFGTTVHRSLVIAASKPIIKGDLDGQPNQIIETTSNSTKRITIPIPAYWKYPGMNSITPDPNYPNDRTKDKVVHMLTETCQTKIYAGPEATGTILREKWNNITGTSGNDLRAKLYSRPDVVDELPSFSSPVNDGDNYGQRLSGYITAPTTGFYTFWIRSDDNSELWLSASEDPSDAQKIAYVTGYTTATEWTKYTNQQSAPISLVAGQRYYIEALHKEGGGEDHVAVRWQLPNSGAIEEPIPGNRLTPMPTPKNLLSSQFTTWSNTLGSSAYVPHQSYAWSVDKSQSGTPASTFVDFDPAHPTDNNWKLTGRIEKYDQFGNVLQTIKPMGGMSVTVYRNDIGVPIGSIANAHFDECGVYTGDYSEDKIVGGVTYLDYANGWEKQSGTTVVSTHPHFGEKTICVNAQSSADAGPARYFRVDQGEDYIFSAWVNVISGTLALNHSYWYLIGAGVPFSKGASIGSVPAPTTISQTNGWQFIKIKIPASTDIASANWTIKPGIRAAFGTVGSTVAYIDDIRFYPAKALASTTYYDSKWQSPIVSVDQTNNPSPWTEYNDFGQACISRKIDKTNPASLKLLKETKTHLAGEQQVFPDPTKWYRIKSKLKDVTNDYCLDVNVGAGTVTSGQSVHLYHQWSADNQKWKFVPVGNGYYNIVSKGNPLVGISNTSNSSDNGALLTVAACTGTGQQWRLFDGGSDEVHQYYKIACKASPRVLIDIDQPAGQPTVADGRTVHLYGDWGGQNQLWYIEEVTP